MDKDAEKKESKEPRVQLTPDPAHPPDPTRFEVYDEVDDGSGFYLPNGGEFFYQFDKFGGWFDEFGNYYDCNGQPAEAPDDVIVCNKLGL